MKNKFYYILLLSISITVFSCSKDSSVEEEIEIEEEIEEIAKELKAAKDYYDATLKPVINNNCTICHLNYHNQGTASDYSIFENALSRSANLYSAVNSGYMPKDGEKLSQEDIDKFKMFSELVDAID